MELMHASREWSRRPADERFVSLLDLEAHFTARKRDSRQATVSSRGIMAKPASDNPSDGLELMVRGTDAPYTATHFSFGQLAQLAKAPPGYLRSLPAALAADNLNYGLQFARDVEDVGVMTTLSRLMAATGPNYGRVWNADLTKALVAMFGDGRTGTFKIPGEFGKDVPITKDNTTLYGSDRDIFIFLADEKNRLIIPDRRNGEPGSLARGFFVWNSEVGDKSIGAAFFLFDYACCNRIVWGAQQFKEIRLRHTSGAPDRWLEQIDPVLVEYVNASVKPVEDMLKAAKAKKIDDVNAFLAKRFSQNLIPQIEQAHVRDEGRPIETVFDAVTGVTALARTIKYQDQRVALEREGGKILDMAA